MARRGQGEGAIYEQGGRWRAVIEVGWERGKRNRKYLSGKTKRDVLQKLAHAQQTRAQGLPVPAERQTVGRYLERWLADVAERTVRASTFVRYRELLVIHAIPVIGNRPLAKLSPQDLQALYAEKQRAGLSAQTVVHLHRVLHRALVQAVRWNLMVRNVADLVDPPRVIRKEIRPLDAEQSRRFLAAVAGDRGEALYVLAVTTGMRQGEIIGLRWTDIDLEAGTLSVKRTLGRVRNLGILEDMPKTAKSRRSLRLTRLAVATLRTHRMRQKEERLRVGALWQDQNLVFANAFGGPMNTLTLTRRFHRLLKQAGLPRVRFHDLRHGTASLLLALGEHPKVVQELLGHSTIGITMDLYSHVAPTLQDVAVDRLGHLLEGQT
jgi:integrase